LQFTINLFNHYGYIVLLIALMLELLAFPLPGEALMTYCGYVIYEQKMNLFLSILVSAIGTSIGITLSYLIGRALGISFFEKYGHIIHLDKKRLDKISLWFQGYGNKLLIIAFFIPGVRHITGYFSGITKISYKRFALNAYFGAFIWTTTFISLGKVLGANWEKYHSLMKKYLLIGSIVIAIIVVLVYLYRNYKQKIYTAAFEMLNNGLKIFHSLGRIKALIAGITVLFLVFSALVIGLIQDFLAHEFNEFDEVAKYLVIHIFNENWISIMKIFNNLSNKYVLILIFIITAALIIIKGINKLHEIKLLSISFLGTGVLNYLLRIAFHRIGPIGTKYTFPSGEVLMTVVVYGYLAYMILKYIKKTWINAVIVSSYFVICIALGLSMVYFNLQYPSDIVAGYEFGVVWLSLNLVLLEVFRILPSIKR
jgi:membrane protein DedA with SNARE-associated domain/membrane-associated phospholipid phosphatase